MKSKRRRVKDIIRIIYKQWKKNLPKFEDPCPDEETMACFVEGLLNKKEQERLQDHLIKCDKCMEIVLLVTNLRG